MFQYSLESVDGHEEVPSWSHWFASECVPYLRYESHQNDSKKNTSNKCPPPNRHSALPLKKAHYQISTLVQIAAASYFNLYSASRSLLHCARLQHERQCNTAQEECTECVGRFCTHSVGRIAPSAQCGRG